jgi:hypothetical protein
MLLNMPCVSSTVTVLMAVWSSMCHVSAALSQPPDNYTLPCWILGSQIGKYEDVTKYGLVEVQQCLGGMYHLKI